MEIQYKVLICWAVLIVIAKLIAEAYYELSGTSYTRAYYYEYSELAIPYNLLKWLGIIVIGAWLLGALLTWIYCLL